MSFILWMSITSGRNLRFLGSPFTVVARFVIVSASCSSLARGCCVKTSPSKSMSSSDELSDVFEPAEVRLFFIGLPVVAVCTHSGAGLSI